MIWFKGSPVMGLDWNVLDCNELDVLHKLRKNDRLTQYGRAIGLGDVFEFYEQLRNCNAVTSKGYLVERSGLSLSSNALTSIDLTSNLDKILTLSNQRKRGEQVSRPGIGIRIGGMSLELGMDGNTFQIYSPMPQPSKKFIPVLERTTYS
ncbi:MAG TPA: hypothetical protein VKE88_02690 [Candidatus Nanoarchaeia archaeon]|nr:hypothetical protein [Candidatus Nanoarchaeia archaeon]